MSYPATVFPRPPPTHNTLTNAERSHLLRSNAKISQLLGSTPHVVDETRSLALSERSSRRQSLPTSTAYEPQPHSPSPSLSLSGSTLDLTSSRSSSESSHSSRSSIGAGRDSRSEKGWRIPFASSRRPPILRLGRARSCGAYSPLSGSPTSSSSSSSYSSDDDDHAWPGDTDAPPSPTFSIPSASSLRRQKMARLRKRLGEGVPVHLVFPAAGTDSETDADDRDSEDGAVAASLSLKPLPALPQSPRAAEVVFRPDPRRSRFAHPVSPVAGTYPPVAVHYAGTHGFEAETFKGIGFTCRSITTIPEE